MEEDQKFFEGFNDGYFLAKYSEELTKSLTTSKPSNDPYHSGILAGGKEYEQEKVQSRETELRSLREDKGKDKEMEK